MVSDCPYCHRRKGQPHSQTCPLSWRGPIDPGAGAGAAAADALKKLPTSKPIDPLRLTEAGVRLMQIDLDRAKDSAAQNCYKCGASYPGPHDIDCPLFVPICACGAAAGRLLDGQAICSACRREGPPLVREARAIVAGTSRKLATAEHLRALLAQIDEAD